MSVLDVLAEYARQTKVRFLSGPRIHVVRYASPEPLCLAYIADHQVARLSIEDVPPIDSGQSGAVVAARQWARILMELPAFPKDRPPLTGDAQ